MQAAKLPKTWMQEIVAAQLVGEIPLLWGWEGRSGLGPRGHGAIHLSGNEGGGLSAPNAFPVLRAPTRGPALPCPVG